MSTHSLRGRLRLLAAVAALATGTVLVSAAQAGNPQAGNSGDVRLMNGAVTPAVVAPATLTAEDVSVPYPVRATGFSAASLSATISVPSGRGTFSFTTTSGLTALFGYPGAPNAPASGNEVGFYGSNADVVNALANSIRWTGGSTGDVTVSVSVTAYVDGVFFNPVNGHYYEQAVSGSAITWLDASNSAGSRTRFGLTGYLTTITSQSENDFIASKVNAQNVWIGATDNSSYIAGGTALSPNPNSSEGQWHWTTGPEAGLRFTDNNAANSQTPGQASAGRFAAWATGEPNDSGSNEHCAVTNWSGTAGRWNDLPCDFSTVTRYIIEYGPGGSGEAASRSIAAEIIEPVLITVSASGDGTVTSSPEGIDCGQTCTMEVVPGLPVTLTATPGAGQRLAGWGGACSGAGTCTFTPTSATNVSAQFELAPVLPPQLPSLVAEPVTPSTTVAPSTTTTTTTVPPTTTAPTPVPDDASGALPALQPGESSVTENGVVTAVATVIENATDLVLRGDGFELRLAGDCTGSCTVQTDASGRQVIQLESNGAARVAGLGFKPGTPVYVWLFSTPTFLGELTVNADGTFSGSVPLTNVDTGTHTLQVNGTSVDDKPRTANLGVVVAPAVAPAPAEPPLPTTGQGTSGFLWGLGLLAVGCLLLVSRRRPVLG